MIRKQFLLTKKKGGLSKLRRNPNYIGIHSILAKIQNIAWLKTKIESFTYLDLFMIGKIPNS